MSRSMYFINSIITPIRKSLYDANAENTKGKPSLNEPSETLESDYTPAPELL